MGATKANAQRSDPYRNFKFKIKFGSEYVAGLSKCSALTRTTEMVEWREGGEINTTRKLPGKTSYEAITLEAGVTHNTDFEDWANKIHEYGSGSMLEPSGIRRNIIIENKYQQCYKRRSRICRFLWTWKSRSLVYTST